jgi:hypothetical protein
MEHLTRLLVATRMRAMDNMKPFHELKGLQKDPLKFSTRLIQYFAKERPELFAKMGGEEGMPLWTDAEGCTVLLVSGGGLQLATYDRAAFAYGARTDIQLEALLTRPDWPGPSALLQALVNRWHEVAPDENMIGVFEKLRPA